MVCSDILDNMVYTDTFNNSNNTQSKKASKCLGDPLSTNQLTLDVVLHFSSTASIQKQQKKETNKNTLNRAKMFLPKATSYIRLT